MWTRGDAKILQTDVRHLLEAELDRVLKEHITEPESHLEWASPVGPVIKQEGTRIKMGICSHYTFTVSHPVCKIKNIWPRWHMGRPFQNLTWVMCTWKLFWITSSSSMLLWIPTRVCVPIDLYLVEYPQVQLLSRKLLREYSEAFHMR